MVKKCYVFIVALRFNCLNAKSKFGVKKYCVFTVALQQTLSVKLTLNCLYAKFKFGLKAPPLLLHTNA